MSISGPVQEVTNSSGGNVGSFNTTIAAPAAGNSLILCVEGSVKLIASVSGGGVTWAPAVTAGGPPYSEIWFGHNSSGSGTAITVTYGGKGSFGTGSINITEWQGLNNALADATNGGAGTLDANPHTGSVSTAFENSLLIATGSWTANDYSSGPTNSFTRRTSFNDGVNFAEAASRIVAALGSYSTAWVLSAGINWDATIAAFGAPAPSFQADAGFFMGIPN